MRVLVTGVRGKVGGAAAAALARAGHEVVGTDRGVPVYESPLPGEVRYVQADLTDAGDAFAVVHDMDAVVHAAAIPQPSMNVAHTVFANNMSSAFNVVEACARNGVARLVNLSSDSVPGFTWSPVPLVPRYCPIDEAHPNLPLDPYAQAKWFTEQLCDALVVRSAVTAVSVRAAWVLGRGNYERSVGPFLRDPALTTPVFWSYVDLDDLADLLVLAVEAGTPGHEVVLAAQPDNFGNRDLHAAVAEHFPSVELRPVDRPDASGYSIVRARALFGWDPRRSWRDHLDEAGMPRA